MEPVTTRRIDREDVYCQKILQTEKNPPRAKYSKEDRENEADVKILKRANSVVTKPITRMGSVGGRPKKYTPTKLRNRINDFFADCEKKDKLPTLKSMMLFLKMNQASMYNYMKDPMFEQVMQQARLIITDWLESDIYNGKGQAAGKLAFMMNNHGWTNKTEVETSTREISVDEARAKIEALAPALLEMLKSSPELMQQLLPFQPVEVKVVENE